MNKRGQALIEFVLLLPVLIIIFFAIIDFSRIYYEKERLENISSDILDVMETNVNYEDAKKIIDKNYDNLDLKIKYTSDNYIEIKISKKLTLITPGLNYALSNPYEVSVKRYVPYEQ